MSKFIVRRLALIVILFAAAPVLAEETGPAICPEAAPVLAPAPTTRDMLVLLRVRQALRADDVLAPMNVGVILRNGVATLWGPLASTDEIQRALKTVADVRGVQSVRSELYVARDCRPLPPLFVLPETPTPGRTAPPDTLASAGPTGMLAALEHRLAAPKMLPAPGSNLVAPLPANVVPDEPTTVTSARAESVPAAIDRLQKSDARFGQINVDWRDGTILLRGSNRNDGPAVMAFARLLSGVPGVERVVLQNAKRPPS